MMPLLDIVEGLLLLRIVTIIVCVVLSDSQSSSSTSVVAILVWWLLEWSNNLGWIFLCGVCIYRLIVVKSFNSKISHWCWGDRTSYIDDNDDTYGNRSGGFSLSHVRNVLAAIRDCLVSNFYYPKRNTERSGFERTERYKELNSSWSHSPFVSQIFPVFGNETIRYDEENLSKATKFQHDFYGGNRTRSKSQADVISSSAIELGTFTNGTQPTSRPAVIPPKKSSIDRGEDTTMANNTSEDSCDNNERTDSTLHNRKDL